MILTYYFSLVESSNFVSLFFLFLFFIILPSFVKYSEYVFKCLSPLLVRAVQETPKTSQAIAIALGFSPEMEDRVLQTYSEGFEPDLT